MEAACSGCKVYRSLFGGSPYSVSQGAHPLRETLRLRPRETERERLEGDRERLHLRRSRRIS